MNASPHIAMLVPANNTTMALELPRWMPPGGRYTTLRIPRSPGLLTSETLPAYCDHAVDLGASLADSDVNLIAYGCTAAGFILGPEGDADIAKRLSQASGKPVVTTAGSMISALQQVSAQSIALLTPYQDDVNTRLRAFLSHYHIETAAFDSFYVADVNELGRITAEQVRDRALALARSAQVDALFIACSQLPTAEITEELQQTLGIPVLSSIGATAQQARNHLKN